MEQKYITDLQGNKVIPITHVDAVRDDEGNSLPSIMGAFEDEVRGLVDTPHQEYVTVAATSQTTAAEDVLPDSGQSADTIYRVSNWDGSANSGAGAFDATVYSEFAWDDVSNPNKYVFLCVKSQIGEVFDISVYNNNAKYADLAAALNGGANIPQSLQKGGMSVKFVQSSDNNYVQFRYMGTSIDDADFTNVANWQGVDNELTVGSKNLITSGGVAEELVQINGGTFNLPITELSGKYYGPDGELYDFENGRYAEVSLEDYAGGTLTLTITNAQSGSSCRTGIYKNGAFVNVISENIYSAPQTWTIPENATLRMSHNKNSSVNISIILQNKLAVLEEKVSDIEGDLSNKIELTDEISNTQMLCNTLYDKDGNVATHENITTANGIFLQISNGKAVAGAAIATSNFVDVSAYNKIILHGCFSNYTSIVAIVCFYEDDNEDSYLNEYICQKLNPTDTLQVTVPVGAKYARFCSVNGPTTSSDGITNFSVTGAISKTVDNLLKEVLNTDLETEIELLNERISSIENGENFDKNADNTLDWSLLNPVKETMGMTAMIQEWGFIGDSLSSGVIIFPKSNSTYDSAHVWKNSFGQKICQLCGTHGINYSLSGLTSKTWYKGFITDKNMKGWRPDGIKVAWGEIKAQAYIIALGTNDISSGMTEGNVATDIDFNDYTQNTDTFVGNYAKIIQLIRSTNEHAPIFCLIQPTAVMLSNFDDSIKAIAEEFDGVYVIDLRTDLDAVNVDVTPYVYQGHWTTQGYTWMAYVISNEVDKIIRNNRAYFDRVGLIGTDKDDGSIVWD